MRNEWVGRSAQFSIRTDCVLFSFMTGSWVPIPTTLVISIRGIEKSLPVIGATE